MNEWLRRAIEQGIKHEADAESVVPYQQLLRASGAYLDQEAARTVRLLELPDALQLEYRSPGEDILRLVALPHRELLDPLADMQRRQQRHPKPSQRQQPNYEDLLRALGYELEQLRAATILIDEVDEGFLVTYQYLDPGQGFMLRKRMTFVRHQDGTILLESSRRRRHKGKHRSLLAG